MDKISGNSLCRWLSLAILALVTLVIYWQCMHHGFIIFDDPAYVMDNSRVREGVTLRNISWAFTTFAASNWHPLTWLSHMLDVQFFGLNPGPHHMVSVTTHLVNSLLLLLLLWRSTGHWWRSLFVAALFALHPLHVESVAWTAERKDVLSTFFMLIAMICYGSYANAKRAVPYLTALFAFALGLLAKPMLVTLPLVLLMWDFWPLNRLPASFGGSGKTASQVSYTRIMVEKVPFFILTVASCLITLYAQQRSGAVAGTEALPISYRLINALASYAGYLKAMVWPLNLAIIYPLPKTLSLLQGAAYGIPLLLVSVVAYSARHRFPFFLTGWFWYLVTLVPVIGIVQVGQQSMADRYTYVPLTGIFIMLSWGMALLAERGRNFRLVLTVAGAMVLCALAVLTSRQVAVWKDSELLFRHAVGSVPGNTIALRMLGTSLAQEGRFAEAEKAFAEAFRIDPASQETHNAFGVALALQKRFKEAEGQYLAAINIDPSYATARYNLGVLLAEEGRNGEAVEQYLAAIRIQPGDVEPYTNLGAAYSAAGDHDRAVESYLKALGMERNNADILYNLGLENGMTGNIAACIDWLKRALAIRPDFAEAHYNLGVALAKEGRIDEAISHFENAVRIDPGMAEARQAILAARNQRVGGRQR